MENINVFFPKIKQLDYREVLEFWVLQVNLSKDC